MELLPCPFCGGEAKLEGQRSKYSKGIVWSMVWCQECKCTLGDFDTNSFDTEKEAIKAWNTRTPAIKNEV